MSIAKIAEIFESIQGEGLYQGQRQLFIRFFGCNLTCRFCDTTLFDYQEFSVTELIREIKRYYSYRTISLTGGEPLLQADFLEDFLKQFKAQNKLVFLETNGVLVDDLRKIINYLDIVSMDFKLPSSTGLRGFWAEHETFLRVANLKEVYVKAIVGKDTSLEDMKITVETIKKVNDKIQLVLQPENPFEAYVFKQLEDFTDICKTAGVGVSVREQLHKRVGIK